jgi:hypothetical protein
VGDAGDVGCASVGLVNVAMAKTTTVNRISNDMRMQPGMGVIVVDLTHVSHVH